MLHLKLSCKLLLASVVALLLLACEQKTELQKAEETAIAFYQAFDKGDKEKAIAFLTLGNDGEELKAHEKEVMDSKIDAIISENIKEFAKRKGLKNITVTESKFNDTEETKAQVTLKVEFNDESNDNNTVDLIKKDGKWFTILMP